MSPRSVALISLGCAKNLVDSESLIARLKALGFALSDDLGAVDLALINTCGFVEEAKRESIDHILETAAALRPGARLFVAGCLAQRYRDELCDGMPEIDCLVALDDYARFEELVRAHFPDVVSDDQPHPTRLTPPHLAYCKIAEGCDNTCTFCAIPLIRGPQVSRPFAQIEAEVARMAATGVQEISLISQQLDAYGRDRYGEPQLAELLARISPLAGTAWIRLHYCYPNHLDDALIARIAALPNVLPYIDMPIQHAADRVLRRMGRRTTHAHIAGRIAALRAAMPAVVLRTAVIVGFPGESEDDFAELLDFVTATGFDQLGCFPFSSEEGTAAARLDGALDPALIAQRHDRLMRAQAQIHAERLRGWVGRECEVLVDGPGEPGTVHARHYGQAFEVDNLTIVRGEAPAGSRLRVTITGTQDYDLLAEPSAGR